MQNCILIACALDDWNEADLWRRSAELTYNTSFAEATTKNDTNSLDMLRNVRIQLDELHEFKMEDLTGLFREEREAVFEDPVITEADEAEQLEDAVEDVEVIECEDVDAVEARSQLENDHEQQVLVLSQQLADVKNKYTALETATQSTIDALQANIIDLNNQVQQQQAEIERLSRAENERGGSTASRSTKRLNHRNSARFDKDGAFYAWKSAKPIGKSSGAGPWDSSHNIEWKPIMYDKK
jgi:hypothetical protein